jgi:hypothetical protein
MNSDYFAPPLENISFVEDRHLHASFSMKRKHISYQVAATECLDVLFEGKKNLPLDFAENSFAFVSGDPLSAF